MAVVKGRGILLAGVLLLVPACAFAGDRGAPASSPGAAVSSPAPAAGYRLYVEDGYGQQIHTVRVLDAGTGKVERDLPVGVPAPDWSILYAASAAAGKTLVRALDPATAQVANATELDGTFWLPYGPQGRAGRGLSADGHWLTLTNFTTDGAGGVLTSRFVLMDTTFSGVPKRIELEGRLDFVALSNDGGRLYLSEYLGKWPAPARTRLRVYDVGAARLDPRVVLDRSADKQGMSVVGGPQAVSPDGRWLYTLFTGQEQTQFVYALDLNAGTTYSVDLPWRVKEKWEEQMLWLLGISPDGNRLYAANAALGMIAEVDITQRRLKRSATFSVPAAAAGFHLFLPVQAKRILYGGPAMSPDGRTLFVPGMTGLVAIDTERLAVRGAYLEHWTIDSIAVSPDGAWLYAVSAERRKVVQVDPATGSIAVEVGALKAPWGLFRVEGKG